MSEEGWQQIKAGLALIEWSKLARWDQKSNSLIAATEEGFESGHPQVHPQFGRLICWLAFEVGSEYLLKGACLVRGIKKKKPHKVFRIPTRDEDIKTWTKDVNSWTKNMINSSVKEESYDFGMLNDIPVAKLLKDNSDINFTTASITLLRDSIRNRDAHRYAKDVRAFHFHVVGMLFVPALNAILASLDQSQLIARISSGS